MFFRFRDGSSLDSDLIPCSTVSSNGPPLFSQDLELFLDELECNTLHDFSQTVSPSSASELPVNADHDQFEWYSYTMIL
jgi:hypothetical protein